MEQLTQKSTQTIAKKLEAIQSALIGLASRVYKTDGLLPEVSNIIDSCANLGGTIFSMDAKMEESIDAKAKKDMVKPSQKLRGK